VLATFYIASLPFQDTPPNGGYRASHDRGAVTVGNEAPLTRPDPLRHFADLRRALTHYARQLARDIDAGRPPPTETLGRARSGAHPPTQALSLT